MSQGLMLVLLLLVATGPERGRGLVLDVQNLPEGGLEVVEKLRALIGDDSNGDAEDSKPVDPQRASDDSAVLFGRTAKRTNFVNASVIPRI
jgi:hypothetical protein